MIIKIGGTIEHGGQQFVVMDIKHQETMDGAVLYLIAYDPNMADKEQRKAIKMNQTSEQMIDMLKKLTGEGGPFGGTGEFKIGE